MVKNVKKRERERESFRVSALNDFKFDAKRDAGGGCSMFVIWRWL